MKENISKNSFNSRIERNIKRWNRLYISGVMSADHIKHEVSRFEHTNKFGTKYQKDYGKYRTGEDFIYFPERWKEKIIVYKNKTNNNQ